MHSKYMLAYGMNTNLEQMARRCPKARSLGSVELKGYRLAFKGCCDILVDPKSKMECALWSITEDCEAALDILEGFPDFYSKKEVLVDHKDLRIRAMIYFMKDYDTLRSPSDRYLNTVVQGYVDHNMDVVQIYSALEEIADAHYIG